jgi:hypothetical protein
MALEPSIIDWLRRTKVRVSGEAKNYSPFFLLSSKRSLVTYELGREPKAVLLNLNLAISNLDLELQVNPNPSKKKS